MNVTLFEGMSVNGMIARPNDDVAYFGHLSRGNFVALAKAAGAMIWGRRTHEMLKGQWIPDLPHIHKFVLTSNRDFDVGSGWQIATSPEEAVRLASEAGAEELLVAGGAGVNTAFAISGLVNHLVLDIGPVVMGEGLSLFNQAPFDLNLTLQEIKYLTPDAIQLHYQVFQP